MQTSNPVSPTAFYCAGARMLDAERPDSLIGDHFAKRFMSEDGQAIFEKFRHLEAPLASNQVRCYLIDEIVRGELRRNPGLNVVLVGAGFDSRAFRLAGGRWTEVDEAPIIERKESVAPAASCPNPLTRVCIDFARESLAGKLAPHATSDETLVVCEGVLAYLDRAQTEALTGALKSLYPRHTLTADVMTRRFIERYGRPVLDVLNSIGTRFAPLEDDPVRYLEGLGYRRRSVQSIITRTVMLGRAPGPRPLALLYLLSRTLREGFRIVVLESR